MLHLLRRNDYSHCAATSWYIYTILFIFLLSFCPSSSIDRWVSLHSVLNIYILEVLNLSSCFSYPSLSEISQVDQDQKISSETTELLLDGGFVVPETVPKITGLAAEDLVSNNDFLAPEINSFGHSFR